MATSRKKSLFRQKYPKGKKSPMPDRISPMLCSLVKEPFTGDDWLFEVKWDGYRIISHAEMNKVNMFSRSGLNYTSRYPLLAEALKKLKQNIILDGEVVVFNSEGKPDFDALQLYNGHDSPIVYCVFDILWLNGYSLMQLPLAERKEKLKELLESNSVIRYSEHFDDGLALYQQMKEMNLEGMVAKKRESIYEPGVRGNNWLKIPSRKRQEFIIGGWAESEKARSFRSILFGAYRNGELEWIGRSGGGFKEKEMPALLKKFKALEIPESPFSNRVLDTKGASIHWMKPELVANFEFATWTKSGRIRKPATFLGLRADKKPADIVREIPVEMAREEKKYLNEDSAWKMIDAQEIYEKTELQLDGCTISVTNSDRQLWRDITKADLIHYYHRIAVFLLPYVKDRPQSLHLKLINATAPGHYLKDMEKRQPACADIFHDKRKHRKNGKRNVIEYLICNNEATLLYMIELGCVDINPWNSRIDHPDEPDYITIDLDPSDEDFSKAIDTAMAAKEIFKKLKLASFVKTSGKTGIHVYIPCSEIKFPEARKISLALCTLIHEEVPSITTLNASSRTQRGNRLLIDSSQNDYADTLAAPYSVRPFHEPTVSAPLDWKELRPGLDRHSFNIHTIEKRLQKKGDLWNGLQDRKIINSNNRILKNLFT